MPYLVDIPFTPAASSQEMEDWMDAVRKLMDDHDEQEITPLERHALEAMIEIVAGWAEAAHRREVKHAGI
jgi:hypothetical protein